MLAKRMDEVVSYCIVKSPLNFQLNDLRFPIIDSYGTPYKFATFQIHPVKYGAINSDGNYVEYFKYPDFILEEFGDQNKEMLCVNYIKHLIESSKNIRGKEKDHAVMKNMLIIEAKSYDSQMNSSSQYQTYL